MEAILVHHNTSAGYDHVSTNAIFEFLGSHGEGKLLNFIYFPEDWRDELQERLKHEWNTGIFEKVLSLERKSNDQPEIRKKIHFQKLSRLFQFDKQESFQNLLIAITILIY